MKAEGRLPPCYRRAIVDTNVIISAILSPRGAPAQLVRRLLREGELVFSAPTFGELETRLSRPKFDPYLTLEERQSLLQDMASCARWCETEALTGTWCRDPDDNKFIALALTENVTRLVTGDADLLCLDPLGELRILTPAQALEELMLAD